jgi:hypothetical protein
MTDGPVELDSRRGAAAQKATEERRRYLHKLRADQEALRRRQKELETLLLAAPAKTWPEAAVKAQYLIDLFSATLEAQESGRSELIAQTLDDLTRLTEQGETPQ